MEEEGEGEKDGRNGFSKMERKKRRMERGRKISGAPSS